MVYGIMTRMCQMDLCYNKATIKMKIVHNVLDKDNTETRLYYICNKCHKDVNPENKRRIYDLTDQKMSKKVDIEGKMLYGSHYIVRNVMHDELVTFRRLIK